MFGRGLWGGEGMAKERRRNVLAIKVAILSDMMFSRKASEKLLTMYFPFLGLGVLATLRGLLSHFSMTSPSHGRRTVFARKKRA